MTQQTGLCLHLVDCILQRHDVAKIEIGMPLVEMETAYWEQLCLCDHQYPSYDTNSHWGHLSILEHVHYCDVQNDNHQMAHGSKEGFSNQGERDFETSCDEEPCICWHHHFHDDDLRCHSDLDHYLDGSAGCVDLGHSYF